MATMDIQVPDIGDFDSVGVIELLVSVGDTVRPEQSLITVESDKASMEIPSSHGGVVKEIKVKIGDQVSQGSVVVVLETASELAQASPRPPISMDLKTELPPAQAKFHGVAPNSVAASTGTPTTSIEVRVPDIGDFKDVAVIELLVKPGEGVRLEQSLVTVESDKASMEIPSSGAGVLKELKVKVGDRVNIGDLLAVLEGSSASAPEAPTAPAGPAAPAPVDKTAPASAPALGSPAPTASAPVPAHDPSAPALKAPHASPSVRKFARELGVPLAEVAGSGPKGRITQDDVQAFTKAVMAGTAQTRAIASVAKPAVAGGGDALGLLPWPKVDFAKFGPVERKDLGRIKKISGANLHRNWVLIPHVTNHDDADITELEALRVATNKENEKSGVKVTMLAFLIKACVAALKKFPDFNSSLDGDQLVLKQYFHIGFAADTPNGLVVPVIKNADQKGVLQISQEMGDLAKKARDGKLGPADMTGACFTISSLGGIGGRYFTPIINAPEVAILGVCKSQMEPVWDGQGFVPRLMLPLSLSWDHRVIDGASAARFNAYLGQILSDFRRVLL